MSEAEFSAWFNKHRSRPPPDGLFQREDKDKDGYISWTEFSGNKGNVDPRLKDEL